MSWSNQLGDMDYDELMHPVTVVTGHKRTRITRDAPSTSLLQRSNTNTFNAEKNFLVENKIFQQQYAAIYFVRLTMMRKVVREAAQKLIAEEEKKNGTSPHLCSNILDVTENTDSIICGTLYKDMLLKPCILDEYSKAKSAGTSSSIGTYMSPTDQLILEDEYGRIHLISSDTTPLDVSRWISGIVVAVRGRMVVGGKFQVTTIIEPGIPPQPIPRTIPPASSPSRYIMFVSGLSIGRPGLDPLPAQLLMDYITGQLGSSAEQSALQSHIVRVVLCGNLLHRFDGKKSKEKGKEKEDPLDEIDAPLKELDLLLTQLAACVDIDLMPGADDPSNFNLPQAPLHKCLFPSAATYSTFHTHQNPVMLDLEGTRMLVHSGQPIHDILKYAVADSPVELLSSTLSWRNMAPTAPDTLGCYPYSDKDPFIITECPHVYVAANQSSYQTKIVTGSSNQSCRVLCIPSFAETGTVVMYNLRDASTHPMKFGIRTGI